MKRTTIYSLLLLCGSAQAQVNEVLKASQFGGITNVSYNPAIAENRMLIDINLISVSAGVENNYIGLTPGTLTHASRFADPNIQSNQMMERLNGNAKKLFAGVQVQGPLSFLYSFGKDRKNAIALSWHVNAIANVDGVSEGLARMAYYGFGSRANAVVPFNYVSLSNENLSIRMLAWTDVGVTYSRVVYDEGPHMFKAGATLKLLFGMAGGYIQSDNINYRLRNYDTLDIYHSDISYGHSGNLSSPSMQSLINPQTPVSVGADLGLIYEWRPDKEAYGAVNGCNDWYRHDVNKYKIAAGIAIVDIGRVRFSQPNNVHSYYANITGWDLKQESIHDLASFDNALSSRTDGSFKADNASSFKMWLPARVNLFVDYEIWKGIGVNLNSTLSPTLARGGNQIHYPTSITITPRYDHKWIGAYLPFSYTEYGNFRVGAGLRLGPLFITSSDIISAFAQNYTHDMNIQAGLKISIPSIKNMHCPDMEKGCKNFNNGRKHSRI
jgi:hypothetical protein